MCDQLVANDNRKIGNRHIPETILNDLQIFEIKQLADKEALYKVQCKAAIRKFKDWQKAYADQTDMIELLYGSMEGDLLREQAHKKARIYWLIRNHFRKAFDIYLKNTGTYKKPYLIAA